VDRIEFAGQRVLVTGAGKGIGRAVVKRLAAERAVVVAVTRDPADLDTLRAETGCEALVCDLADPDATRRAAIAAQPIDLLVNNAGTTALEPFLDTTAETFDHVMAVNARAAMIVAQEAARDMIRRGHKGAIVNVSSTAATIGIADHTAYCASKAALDAITRVMAVELGPHGIRVNSVNPTVTLTPMAVKAWSDPAKAEGVLGRIPLRRFAEPDEVADVILYLLSERAAMVNGVSLFIDGGFRAK
jgi:NAD(P)-dependent dehydrogenase (short-subunit alcohol dehydrogenase family)